VLELTASEGRWKLKGRIIVALRREIFNSTIEVPHKVPEQHRSVSTAPVVAFSLKGKTIQGVDLRLAD
jgi:hypothetical protein